VVLFTWIVGYEGQHPLRKHILLWSRT